MNPFATSSRTEPAAGSSRRRWLGAAVLHAAVLARDAAGTELDVFSEGSEAGSGAFTLSYQYFDAEEFHFEGEALFIGDLRTESLLLELEYALTARWTVHAALPLMRARYRGPDQVHVPATMEPPNDTAPYVDDGEYHGGLQDWRFGVHYLVATDPVRFEPYLNVFVPTHDYPHFGWAVIGQNLWKVELGTELLWFPPWSDAWGRTSLSHVFVEETLGQSVDHWILNVEAGYFWTPAVATSAFVEIKRGDGTVDFPSMTDERWYQHDRMSEHEYEIAGVGVDWALGDRYLVSLSTFRSFGGNTVTLIDTAVTVGVTTFF